MKTFIVLVLLLVIGGFVASAFCFQVEESEYAVVTVFGDPRRIIEEPGLRFKWPWPVESVIRIDRRVNITSPDSAEYLTRDKKNVLVSFFVAWKVADPLRFLVTVNDRPGAESRIQDIIRSEVGAKLGNYNLSDLVFVDGGTDDSSGAASGVAAETGAESTASAGDSSSPGTTGESGLIAKIMDDISASVQGPLGKEFGIDVVAVRMKRLNFPRQNKQAVFERMEAERERIAKQYRSEGEEDAMKLKAEADRQQAELINEAKRKAEEIRGRADAEATRIYAEAYGKDPEFYEFLRKLEALEAFLDQGSTVVLPADSPLLDVLKEDN